MTASRIRPPFRADHVGSLLRPPPLTDMRLRRQRGECSEAELRALEDEHIRQAVRMQEDVGLKGVTDGDFRRNDWFLDFIIRIEGIGRGEDLFEVQFSNDVKFETRALAVTGPVRCPAGGIMTEDFSFLKSVTSRTAKVRARGDTTPWPSVTSASRTSTVFSSSTTTSVRAASSRFGTYRKTRPSCSAS